MSEFSQSLWIHERFLDMNDTYLIDSGKGWPTVWISAWVHGNEHFWVQVTQDFLERIRYTSLPLLRWRVVLILRGNDEALQKNIRFIEDDLNRVVDKVPEVELRDNYEQRRGREVRNLINTIEPQAWLDLHSFSAPTWLPYAFSWLEWYRTLGSQLGIQNMAVNMANANKKLAGGKLEWRGVADYVNDSGACGFTFEAGNHIDPQCLVSTYQALINFLVTQEMTEAKEVQIDSGWESWESSIWLMPHNDIVKIWGTESQHVHIEEKHVFKWGFRYAWAHPQSFRRYQEWELIGHDIVTYQGIPWTEVEVRAPYDGYIIMPKDPEICITGKEVFYYGKDMRDVA